MTDDERPAEPATVGTASEEVFKVVETALYDVWRVANDLARIRPPDDYYRVTIFGSSRAEPGDEIYDEVKRLARDLAAMGCDIVTGGGPGLMQAANEGAKLGDPENVTRSIGLPVTLPHEEEPNPFVEKMYHHETFFTRLHHFVRLSSAFVVVRGGIGTTLEMAMIWQLLQVRHMQGVPLIFIGAMWKDLVAWAKKYMLGGERILASAEDLGIPVCVADADEACAVIRRSLEQRDADA